MNPVNITNPPVTDTMNVLTGQSSPFPSDLSTSTTTSDSSGSLFEEDDPATTAIDFTGSDANADIFSNSSTNSLAFQSTSFFSDQFDGRETEPITLTPLTSTSTSTSTDTLAIPGSTSVEPSKTLMLVGGAWEYPATKDPYGVSIYLDFLERSGGVENAKIGIVTTASATPRKNGKLYVQDFQDLYDLYLKKEFPNQSIDVEWIPLTIDNQERKKNSEAFAEKIKEYTGFIFGGGDQSLLTESFYNEKPRKGTRTTTPLLRALRNRFNNGAVVAGTSAGTTVQTASPMITEGESFESFLDKPTALIGSPPLDPELYYNPLGGLDLFKYGLLDTHFSERGRQGRIIRLAAEVGEDMTYGVDENTALIVSNIDTPDVKMEVLGENGVFISDLSGANVKEKDYWSISGVNTTYLTEGDVFDPLTKTAKFPEKSRFRGTEDTTVEARNIFSRKRDGSWTNPRRFTETAIDLFESKSAIAKGKSRETDPVQYKVAMQKTRNSQGFIGLDNQGEERISFVDLNIDIAPIL